MSKVRFVTVMVQLRRLIDDVLTAKAVDSLRGINGRQNDTGTAFSCSLFAFPAVHFATNVHSIFKCPMRIFNVSFL